MAKKNVEVVEEVKEVTTETEVTEEVKAEVTNDEEVTEKTETKKEKKLTKAKVVSGLKKAGKYALAAGAGAVATVGVILVASRPKKDEVEALEKFDDWTEMNSEVVAEEETEE